MSHIQFYYKNIRKPELQEDRLLKQINFLIINEGKIPGELSIILCDDDYLLEINRQFLDHDYYTDIVTFDYVNGLTISGDLFISLERVRENACMFQRPAMEELFRVIFHGILHLVGYSDHDDEARKCMRERENFYLEGMPGGKEIE